MNTYDDDRGDDIRNALEARIAELEARLIAVIALCDHGPGSAGWLWRVDVRAAATGDTT